MSGQDWMYDSFLETLATNENDKSIIIHIVNSALLQRSQTGVPNSWRPMRHQECQIVLGDATRACNQHLQQECR
jgi:hypothetical protein